jgi:hypothetical protein
MSGVGNFILRYDTRCETSYPGTKLVIDQHDTVAPYVRFSLKVFLHPLLLANVGLEILPIENVAVRHSIQDNDASLIWIVE